MALIAPFVAIYALVFVYPTLQMFRISFTDAPLIGEGKWVGLANYARLTRDPLFEKALWNTAYFVLMTVAPGTLIALLISLGISRLKGRFQALILALFFLPYILPVSVVYLIWDWTLNFQFGVAMHVLDWLGIPRIPVFKSREWFLPAVALGDDLVDRRLLDPLVPRRPARHPERDLRGGRARQRRPAGRPSGASPGRCSGR